MNCICGIELSGKQRFCSDKCRKRTSRTNSDKINAPESNMKDELGQVGHNVPPEIVRIEPELVQNATRTDELVRTQSRNKPDNYGQDNCQCYHCKTSRINKNPKRFNHGDYMTAQELALNGYDLNRVTLPGDVDYGGVCN
jgi:hypothetical protein